MADDRWPMTEMVVRCSLFDGRCSMADGRKESCPLNEILCVFVGCIVPQRHKEFPHGHAPSDNGQRTPDNFSSAIGHRTSAIEQLAVTFHPRDYTPMESEIVENLILKCMEDRATVGELAQLDSWYDSFECRPDLYTAGCPGSEERIAKKFAELKLVLGVD
ncbi:MAG: hypothetical protein EOP04_28190 [Proteobacteria bacterium]|nr:MAG: hypothetical protein EOP04_28190 [Pseudomonadota bacterium]